MTVSRNALSAPLIAGPFLGVRGVSVEPRAGLGALKVEGLAVIVANSTYYGIFNAANIRSDLINHIYSKLPARLQIGQSAQYQQEKRK